ncbi:hypothetical protein [Pseudomonas hunanensis]|jgi:hypothetical protein|uniref:hypothetical protein n=1 Tax=Pseudomonas hunanensis TaxID=1247546 RepID=UPI00261B6877|nr:hypothetical protein [uncultured Bradyrhizobium sp.]
MTTRLEQMTRALSLYDAAGDGASSAACLLQGAIDSERGLRPLQPGEEIDAALLDEVADSLEARPNIQSE